MPSETAKLPKPPTDALRDATFREIARDIVSKDREMRKFRGSSTITADITRALQRAYRSGFEDAHAPPEKDSEAPPIDPDDAIEWNLISPKARTTFWTICLRLAGRDPEANFYGLLRKFDVPWSRNGEWHLYRIINSQTAEKAKDVKFGQQTIAPLLRLNLLQPFRGDNASLIVSPRGSATWKLFLSRGGQFPDDFGRLSSRR